jgi:hypothetical protein
MLSGGGSPDIVASSLGEPAIYGRRKQSSFCEMKALFRYFRCAYIKVLGSGIESRVHDAHAASNVFTQKREGAKRQDHVRDAAAVC